MNPGRYARAKEIFLTAAALPAGRREAYLEQACGGDADLRAEIDSLLAHRDNPAAVLRTGGLASLAEGAFAREVPEAASRALLPERIGPCRILGILGEGGMGIVYRAEQTSPVHREVALKLIRGGTSSSNILARFEVERQTLAMMDHPNIARLFDAGATEDGQPYVLMELIRGVPLTEYARARSLPVRERLDLFRKVCGAVRHAHQRGIIHRDLKPSNILVTESEGAVEPKVIDFSIAKALTGPGIDTEFRTREGQLVGTLEYMAPEQAMGRIDAVDTRTDVYALGVVLYELLTDNLPIDIKGVPLHEAIRKIAEAPVRTLGGARTTATGGTRVDADLATIVGKCLAKEPDRRYGSAAQLVEDVERYLGSRPIAARPPSAMYQLRKLVARHRLAAGFLATVFALLSIFAVTTQVQLVEQRRARAAAESQARKAERISAFLQHFLASADPGKTGGRLSIREALDRAAESVEQGLEEDPEVVVEIERVVGDTYQALDLRDQAISHYRAGLRLRRATLADPTAPDLPTARILLRLSVSIRGYGEHALAQRWARLSASMGFALEGPDSPVAAEALVESAWAAVLLGHMGEAARDAARSVEIRRRILPPGDPDLAMSLQALGAATEGEAGERSLREALAIQKEAPGADSHQYLETLNLLYENLSPRTRATPEELIAMEREVLQGFRRIHGEDSAPYALAANNLGTALLVRPEYLEEAEAMFGTAYSTWRRGSERGHHTLTALQNLAYTRAARGKYGESASGYRTVLSLWSNASEADRFGSWIVIANLGVTEHLLGDQDAAERDLRRGLGIARDNLGADHFWTRVPEGWLACVLVETGRAAEAERLLRHSLTLAVKTGGDLNSTAFLANMLGGALAAQGKKAEAEREIEKSRAYLLDRLENPRELRHALERTAALYAAWGKREDAAACRAALARLNAATRGSGAVALTPRKAMR